MQGRAEPAAVCHGMRGRAVSSSSSASDQRVGIFVSNVRTCIRGIGNCRATDDWFEASATNDTVVGCGGKGSSDPPALSVRPALALASS